MKLKVLAAMAFLMLTVAATAQRALGRGQSQSSSPIRFGRNLCRTNG